MTLTSKLVELSKSLNRATLDWKIANELRNSPSVYYKQLQMSGEARVVVDGRTFVIRIGEDPGGKVKVEHESDADVEVSPDSLSDPPPDSVVDPPPELEPEEIECEPAIAQNPDVTIWMQQLAELQQLLAILQKQKRKSHISNGLATQDPLTNQAVDRLIGCIASAIQMQDVTESYSELITALVELLIIKLGYRVGAQEDAA
jgi:hypothetical protein